MKSHTGLTFSIGPRSIYNESTKQKVNARTSTETELIVIDNKIAKVILTKKFVEEQEFDIN